MGLDMRIVANDCRHEIVDALTSAGYEVRVCELRVEPPDDLPDQIRNSIPDEPLLVYEITVRRGDCEIKLSYAEDEGEYGGYRIYIPNLRAWRPKRNRQLRQFQADVTSVLESVGAYWPFPDTAG
jgi:hypothetical protein